MSELEKYIKEYLDHLEIEKNRSKKTRENYERYLKVFIDLTKAKGLKDLTDELIRQFRITLASTKMKKNTQSYYVIALRNFLKYLAKRGLETVPPERVELPKMERSDIETIEYQDLERLLRAPQGSDLRSLRDRAILEVLFSTGLRLAELVNLPRRIDLNRGELSVRGKGGKIRVVFLSGAAKDALKHYLYSLPDENDYLFTSLSKGGKPIGKITPRAVERLVDRYARIAGIGKKIHPHQLRHCLHKDTRVVLIESIASASEVLNNKEKIVQSFNFQKNQVAEGAVVRSISHKNKNFVQIWASGREIICSPHHTFFTVTKKGIETIEAQKITPRMYLAGIKDIQYQGKQQASENFWRLVGYIIGDGTLSEKRHGIIISENNDIFA